MGAPLASTKVRATIIMIIKLGIPTHGEAMAWHGMARARWMGCSLSELPGLPAQLPLSHASIPRESLSRCGISGSRGEPQRREGHGQAVGTSLPAVIEVVIFLSMLRRHRVVLSLAFLAVLPAQAATAPAVQEYRLRFFHTHTGERLDIVYRQGSRYLPQALSALDRYLRDHRTGEVHHYDPRLFDLLYDLTVAAGVPDAEIDVVCGYRAPSSNEFLRTHTRGVALHSLHMQAQAIDIRLPGIRTSRLRDAALALHRGGVGYYASSDFIHVDVGRVRRW
jgi:uncharacterized protein YcbK (DUF882 family)